MLKGFGRRLLSLILCVAMIAALLPQMQLSSQALSASDVSGKTVDPSTLEGWQVYFGSDMVTTEYTGGIWTDKSVFKNLSDYLEAEGVSTLTGPNGAASAAINQMLQTDPANFLVALSAIAANQQITGYTTKPTDTMFVLDVSNSMDQQRYVPGMIEAANEAIKTLMDGNPHNRVGVVLFSGSSSFGNSGTGTAMVLLPLDHYTSGNAEGTFLRYTGNSDTTVYVATNVKNGDGDTMSSNTGKNTVGGTYIQNGVYKAWQQFEALSASDTVIPEGQPQAGIKRTPALVLMTDGQPTSGDTTYYDVGTSNIGDGGTPDETEANRLTFLNQLTLAWVKAKMANKYGVEGEEALIYTVGLNTSTNAFATDVLNPEASTNTTVEALWDAFVRATPNYRGQVTLSGWTTYKSTDGMITSVNQRIYPTEYFAADDTDALAVAFSKIADTLTRKTPYVTLVNEGNVGSTDGYVTIEDQLGVLMEVHSVKGLVLGDRIFTGAELAKAMAQGQFGSATEFSEYGNELVRTVQERLGVASVSDAQDLLRAAWATGQLSYTSATEYSNYIGWYEDADGRYLGHWEESDGYDGVGAPEGAVYINKSYGYLGSEDVGSYLTDMMHVVVMVRTKISTGDQAVIYKIPASLIPTVLYNVSLTGTDATKPTDLTREAAEPMRLLVEVGLRREINPVNLEAKVSEYVAGGGHIHKNADGTYSFYTNRWGDGDGGAVDYDLPLTHLVTESHFHPATDNVRYYFVDDTLVYSDRSGTVYTGSAAPSGTGYYYARNYYENVNGTTRYITEYVQLEAVNAAKAVKKTDGWYIPAGTPQQLTRFALTKTDNATETLAYSWNPVILHDNQGYNSYAFLGNNGSFTLAPAQGIALSKTVAETVEGAPTQFTFTVDLSQEAPELLVTDENGNPLENIATVSGTRITVTLTDGQTVYLTGIPTGTAYTVTEAENGYYAASSNNAAGTVSAYRIHAVDFTNTPKGYGSLIVGKDVTYPQGFNPGTAHNEKQFTVEVAFNGDVSGMVIPTGAQLKLGTESTYEIALSDGQSVTFTNIPEGVTYTVTETAMPTGYSLDEIWYADGQKIIAKDDLDEVKVINTYAPAAANANLKIQGTKTVENGQWPEGASFTVRLWQVYDFGSGEVVKTNRTATVTASNASYTIDISDIAFNRVGTYYIRIAEDIPEDADRIADMAYDRTMGLISITVTDEDADGKLEVGDTAVVGYQGTPVTGNAADGWTVTKDFTNVVTKDLVYIDVEKSLEGYNGSNPPLADITFGLFESLTDETPAYYGLTDGEGKVTLLVPVTASGIGQGKVYYLREIAPAVDNRIVGMHYDESWLYALQITWDTTGNKAVVEYAPIVDGQVGTYAPYDRQSVTFSHTNSYTSGVQSTPAIEFSGEKTVNGSPNNLGERVFEFNIYEADATFRHGDEPLQTVRNSGGSITFDGITYDSAGMKYLVIKEAATDLKGITVDSTEYHVTVRIEKYLDNGVTKLRVADGYPTIVKYGTTDSVAVDTIDFHNRYTLTGSVSTTLEGTKALTGRALHAGAFTFELYKGNDLVQSVTNRSNGSFSFDALTFGPEDLGVHTYTVVEKQPAEAVNNKYQGVTYSTQVYTVEITVSDNGEGGLSLVKKVNGSENGTITFRNSYTTGSATARITGSKTWYNVDTKQNIALDGGEFSFELYRSNEGFTTQGSLVKTVENGAGGTIALSLTYDQPGEHYYIFREAIGNDTTVGYDASRYFIRVLVTDDGVGNLHSTVTVTEEGTGSSSVAFGNSYTPAPVKAAIEGTKELSGRDLVDGEFTFLLLDENEQELARTENVGGSFVFDAIEYENTGVYTYKVIELIPDSSGIYKGVTYDRTIYTVTVTVADNGGILKETVEVKIGDTPVNGLVFRNSYEGADTHFEISGRKTLAGKDLQAGQFTFELVDVQGVHIATTHNDANGDFTFTNIPLEAAGEYTFYVREVQPDGAVNKTLNGITYDDTSFKVTVSVTDPGTGQLEASTPVVENGPIVFTNTYAVEPVQATIRARKILTGRTLEAGEFTFELYEGNTKIQQTTNKADGTIAFQPITYTEAGEYTYEIREVEGQKGGITYDTGAHTVYVDVTDNGDGTLSTDVVYQGGNPVFENTYTVTGETQFTLEGTKVLEGREMNGQDVFTFELKDASGQTVATAQAENGKFTFEDVTLTTLGLHTFTVTEKTPADAADGVKNGITYSTQVYTVEVNVTDNGTGGMVAGAPVVSYNGKDVASMVFTNTYRVTEGTTVNIEGTKTLTGNKTLEADMYTFELYAGTDTAAEPVATAKNAADGSISFPDVEVNTLGINTFTVVEQTPEGGKLDGVTYSTLVYTVTVETTDNGVGGMTAGNPVYYLGQVQQPKMEFINSYAVEGEVPAIIQAKKTLEGGRVLNANDFTFELYEGTAATGEPIALAQNQADGTVLFGLTYTAPGTYTYTLRELAPDGYFADNIHYSQLTYQVTVRVDDNGVGGMTVQTPVYTLEGQPVAAAQFVNTYEPAELPIELVIEKTVKVNSGEGIGPEDFVFELWYEDQLVGELTTDAEGKASMTLYAEAESIGQSVELRVVERDTGIKGVTYSTAEYLVGITIAQNDDGTLRADLTVNGQEADQLELAFINTYDKSVTPDTGDEFSIALFVGLMAASAAGLVVLLLAKKKKES